MGGGASLPQDKAVNYQFQQQPLADKSTIQSIQSLNTNPNAAYNSAGALGAGSALTGSVPQLTGYAGQALTNAFDPQQALFNQQFAQQQNQQNAVNAQNGVAGTPYGAGLSNQANQNFDIAWQAQQLANQNQGANTAASLLGAGGNAATQGTALGQSVATLNNQQIQQQIADFLNYLSGGTSASGVGNQAYAAEANAALQNQQLMNDTSLGYGKLAGQLLFSPLGGS